LAADGRTSGLEAADAVLAAEKANLLSEAKTPERIEPTAIEMANRAKELLAKAKADGRTLSASDAVAQARRELIQS